MSCIVTSPAPGHAAADPIPTPSAPPPLHPRTHPRPGTRAPGCTYPRWGRRLGERDPLGEATRWGRRRSRWGSRRMPDSGGAGDPTGAPDWGISLAARASGASIWLRESESRASSGGVAVAFQPVSLWVFGAVTWGFAVWPGFRRWGARAIESDSGRLWMSLCVVGDRCRASGGSAWGGVGPSNHRRVRAGPLGVDRATWRGRRPRLGEGVGLPAVTMPLGVVGHYDVMDHRHSDEDDGGGYEGDGQRHRSNALHP